MLEVGEHAESTEPLVGRSWELDAAISKIELVRYSLSSVVTIEGASGVGKTRLMQELIKRCEGLGLRSSIWATNATPQFELQAMATLKSLMPLTDSHRSPASIALKENYRDEVALAAVLTRKIESLCRKRGQDRLILFVEDGHWIDAISAAVFRRLVLQSYLPVCVVLSARRKHATHSDGIDSLLNLRETTRVRLQPLNDDDIARLITGMDLEHSLSPAWLAWCQRTAVGNPMYAQALARAAVDELNEDRRDPDDIVINPKVSISANVRGDVVLNRRISALSDEDRKILISAAVVGINFSTETVVQLVDQSAEEVMAALERGYRHGVVEKLFANKWKFSHPLISSVLINALDGRSRQALRRKRVAQMKQDSSVSELERAEQMVLADLNAEAVKIYVGEARKAATLGAHREAAALFRRADSLARTEECRRLIIDDDARLSRIRALFAISSYEEAADLLQKELRARDGSRLGLMTKALKTGFANDRALRSQFHEETRVLGVLARHSVELGFFQNRFSLLLRSSLRTVGETLWTGHKNERGLSLAHASFVATILGLDKLSNVLMVKSAMDIREAWNIAGLVEHALIANIRLSHLGQYRQVEASTSAALAWLDEHEDPLRFEMILALRSLSHLLRGDIVTAERWHTQCLASARSSRNIQATVWSLGTLIYCKVMRGETCEDHVDELEIALKQTVPMADCIYAEGALAVWAETQGREGRWGDLIDKINDSPVGPYFLIVPIDCAISHLIHRARSVQGRERQKVIFSALKLMIRVSPNLLSNGPIKVPLLLRLAELSSLLGNNVMARWAAEKAKSVAGLYDMSMYGLLAEAIHPDADEETRERIVRELRIALGSEWHASWLEARSEEM